MVTVVTVLGALLAACIAAIVFVDARNVGADAAWVWALGVASFGCFVVADVDGSLLWAASLGSRNGTIIVTSPAELLAFKAAVGIVLSLVVLVGYGFGTRRVATGRNGLSR